MSKLHEAICIHPMSSSKDHASECSIRSETENFRIKEKKEIIKKVPSLMKTNISKSELYLDLYDADDPRV